MRRVPEGYSGRRHETLGSDILSVLRALSSPELVLGAELTSRVKQLSPGGWYPIEFMLEVMDVLDARVGRVALVQMGRRLFAMSHQERVQETALSAGDILFGIDAMYRHANRGEEIGGWTVTRFRPGSATLEKRTPHHCALEEGILSEALKATGVPVLVSQTQCLKAGAPLCIYSVTSNLTGSQWKGRYEWSGENGGANA